MIIDPHYMFFSPTRILLTLSYIDTYRWHTSLLQSSRPSPLITTYLSVLYIFFDTNIQLIPITKRIFHTEQETYVILFSISNYPDISNIYLQKLTSQKVQSPIIG